MAAVSQKVPNLLGGVSQQPDPVKLAGQVRSADNVYLDPTFGCRKRPGTEFVAQLANDVPADARWFPIFRDNNERYVVAIYNNPTLVLRVWDLNDGTERTVTIDGSAADYFSGATQDTIEQVTVADYTLITNTEAKVSMNTDTSADLAKEALVVVDQVAYNSTYSIDIAKDGDTTPNKVYSATGLEVIPGSFEVEDGGSCSGVDAQLFTQSGAGGKSGLTFRLVNQCQAYLKGSNSLSFKVEWVEGPYAIPNYPDMGVVYTERLEQYTDDSGLDAFQIMWKWTRFAVKVGNQFELGPWEWGLTADSVTAKNSKAAFEGSNPTGRKLTGNDGGKIKVKEVSGVAGSDARYVSRYRTDVQLQNGGVGWRVGDTTTVSMGGFSFTVRVTKERFVYAYNSAGSANYTTPASTDQGVLDVGAVVGGLVTGVNAIADFSAESTGNVIKIKNTAGRDFNLSVRGGVTNKAMTVIKGLARDIADLPTQCFDGYTVKVNNTDDSDADDYYVKFTTEAPGIPGAGSWEETVAPSIKTNINSSTMPHALIRQADGSFTLGPLNDTNAFGGWAGREVGDEVTNPEPSFVERSISNLFFFANRLGFLSEDAVIMSQPGDYFNFFTQSAIAISDADPIDITASSTIPAILKGVVGTPKGLILFAERSQFLLATSEIAFSTATVKLTEISNYFYRSRILPLNSGVSVSFISESATYSKVMEMAVDSVDNRPVVADITRVIPEYLPPDFILGEVLPNNNMLLYGEGTDEVYVFKFFNNGDERQLAGWTRWIYPAPVKLMAAEDDLIHSVMFDGEKYILCRSELIDDPDIAPLDVGFSSFSPRLDVSLPGTAFTIEPETTKTSKVRIPDTAFIAGTEVTLIVTSGDHRGTFIQPEVEFDVTGAYIVSPNNLIEDEYVLGYTYTASVELPTIFLKTENKADRVNVPMVSFLHLELYYSGRYEATLSRLGYPDTYKSIEITPANIYDANAVPVAEIGTATIPVFAPGNIVKMKIEASDPYPSAITGYSWDGSYNNRGVQTLR